MRRATLGFLVAPLWAPMAAEINALRNGVEDVSIQITAALAVSAVAYGMTFVAGFPLLRWLGTRTRLWILVLAGAAGGLLICLVLLIFFWAPVVFRFGLGLDTMGRSLGVWIGPATALATVGALIGATFWLIAHREYQPEDNAQYF